MLTHRRTCAQCTTAELSAVLPVSGHHTPQFGRRRNDSAPNALQQQGHKDRCGPEQHARRMTGGVPESFHQRAPAHHTQLGCVPEHICSIPCGNQSIMASVILKRRWAIACLPLQQAHASRKTVGAHATDLHCDSCVLSHPHQV